MNKEIYQKLAGHLDRLPDGFPPSRTGADLRLLEMLFSSEEAELAVHLGIERESAGVIAARAGLPEEVVAARLDEMVRKGLIFCCRGEDGPWLYQAVPLVVGLYEFQVNNLTPGLLRALDDYWSTIEARPRPPSIPQMRTIPVRQSIENRLEAMPYEQVGALVDSHARFAVAPCICRRTAKIAGAGCAAPEESCLIFDDWADYYVRKGLGRAIDRAEVLAIIARADAANLVLQPSNSRSGEFLCCCCGCCCGILAGLKRHPRPADVVSSAFIATLEPELCQGCWTCLERCQMQALVMDGERVALKMERCIGCGLCVSTCPSGALSLARKPESAQAGVPQTMEDTWRIIMQDQIREE
ncbi:MAG: 4Fe-4S binding protein [Anaerolineales bacterium]|nr:4Fe-4S binding protein [Anaerolineales bacterium]